MALRRALILVGLSTLLLACPACSDGPKTTSLFEVPRDGSTPAGYYALPFPNDIRVRADGTTDLDGHIRPNVLIDIYLNTISERVRGFSTNGAIFVRFSDPIDPTSLPQSASESSSSDASVQLINLRDGKRWPLLFRFQSYFGESIGRNWLSCLPYPGYPLAPGATYALVVTDSVVDEAGESVGRSSDFELVMAESESTDPDVTRARAAYLPLQEFLDTEPGLRSRVINAAVFTTQVPTVLIGDARAVIWRDVTRPTPRDVQQTDEAGDYWVFEGKYDAPNFQTGAPPYRDGTGHILTDATTGEPIIQRTEELRFAITVPKGAMPPNGWPIAVYAHGTGGNYRTFESNGTGRRLAQQGVATISIDQPMHGTRGDGSMPTEDIVFDYENPLGAMDGIRQGAIDNFQLARLIRSMLLTNPDGGAAIRLDETRMSFMGHSQGGITGALFVAYEPLILGAVLSGAGGLLYQTLLHKPGVLDLVSAFIRDFPLDQFNNLLALVQLLAEASDPVNYGPLLVRNPPEGNAPKDIYQSWGRDDTSTPTITIEALGVAIGAAPVSPVLQPVEGFALRGLDTLSPPVSGNMDGNTAVFVQYENAPGRDGHFVVFDVATARRQHAAFLGTLLADGTATLVP